MTPPGEREALRLVVTKDCSETYCWCHVDPQPEGFFCSACGCQYLGETPTAERDYVKEALSIIAGTSLLLPERPHLTALYELYTLTDQALKDLLAETRRNPQ
jgi:hypothetical protein